VLRSKYGGAEEEGGRRKEEQRCMCRCRAGAEQVQSRCRAGAEVKRCGYGGVDMEV